MRYVKKPVEIEAFKLGHDIEPEWFIEKCKDMNIVKENPNGRVIKCNIPTLEGVLSADKGYYIIKGVKGELYPCKPDIFEMTYDKI